jgi:hypothetical protein
MAYNDAMPGPGYEIDESNFPAIRVHYWRGLSDQEFDELLERFSKLMRERTQPYGLVLQTHHSTMMPIGQARRQAAWMKEEESELKRQVRGLALVLPSPVQRGVLKVVLKLQPIPVPHAVFQDADEALSWVRRRLP